ncbi:MAG: glycerate 2-kinase [Blastocatellia bacterium]|nr:glycerate 2-kinase [Blastocatellia bacterium]
MASLSSLHQLARNAFASAIAEANRLQSLLAPIFWEDAQIRIGKLRLDLNRQKVYAIAIGKAAPEMAATLDRELGSALAGAVIAAPQSAGNNGLQPTRWRKFGGGHPLPNEESLKAAQAAFALLHQANSERALVIFLISGGGSAALEWPVNDRISLNDLREANRILISCGATIAEINAVRRCFSAVKGGKLSLMAPDAQQATLIVSDVNRGNESNVASGPSLPVPPNAIYANDVVERYALRSSLPASIIQTLREERVASSSTAQTTGRQTFVLVDNPRVLEFLGDSLGKQFPATLASEINEQPITTGCELLIARSEQLRQQSFSAGMPVGLISGGEFSCPVRGKGIGGRNLETALRFAIAWDRRQVNQNHDTDESHVVLLSAGTDGIDGNSPAAGAIVDETSIARGRALGLDAETYLNHSDAFSYFKALGDAIETGPTGTNVRDLRIMIAG